MLANCIKAVIVPIIIAKLKDITVKGMVVVMPGIKILENESTNYCQ